MKSCDNLQTSFNLFKSAVPQLEVLESLHILSISFFSISSLNCVAVLLVHGGSSNDPWFEHQLWLCHESPHPSCLLVSVAGKYLNQKDITACASRIGDELFAHFQNQIFLAHEEKQFYEFGSLPSNPAPSPDLFEEQLKQAIALSLLEYQQLKSDPVDDPLERVSTLSRTEYQRNRVETDLEKAIRMSLSEWCKPVETDFEKAMRLSLSEHKLVETDLERAIRLSLSEHGPMVETDLEKAMRLSLTELKPVVETDLEKAIRLSLSERKPVVETDLEKAMRLSLSERKAVMETDLETDLEKAIRLSLSVEETKPLVETYLEKATQKTLELEFNSKRLMEMFGCTKFEAEKALLMTDNNLEKAVILSLIIKIKKKKKSLSHQIHLYF
jgi:hypothetical protein